MDDIGVRINCRHYGFSIDHKFYGGFDLGEEGKRDFIDNGLTSFII